MACIVWMIGFNAEDEAGHNRKSTKHMNGGNRPSFSIFSMKQDRSSNACKTERSLSRSGAARATGLSYVSNPHFARQGSTL